MTASFTCTVCMDDKTQLTTPRAIAGNPVCHDCCLRLIPQFESALASETAYPVTWGVTAIQVSDFADILGDKFVQRYQQREIEYMTAPIDRIYCSNQLLASGTPGPGTTADRKLALTPAEASDAKKKGLRITTCGAMAGSRSSYPCHGVPCYSCNGLTCRKCEQPLFTGGCFHICTPLDRATKDATQDDRFTGLIRGCDYQLCPNSRCLNVVNLLDGCNHLRCPIAACGASFCYICGQEAEDESDHWSMGKPCPRYNQPDADGALFDWDISDNDFSILDRLDTLDEEESEALAEFLDSDDVQPVLDAPPPGHYWFDSMDEDQLDAMAYVLHMVREVNQASDRIDAELVDTVTILVQSVTDLLEFMFRLHRLYRDEPANLAARYLTHNLDDFDATGDEADAALFRLEEADVLQHLPMLMQAAEFYKTHKEDVISQVMERINSRLAESQNRP